MPDATQEPMLEILKSIQFRIGNMEETLRDHSAQFIAVRGDLRSLHTEMAAMKTDIVNLYEAGNSTNIRLSRIERRLEIIDAPIS